MRFGFLNTVVNQKQEAREERRKKKIKMCRESRAKGKKEEEDDVMRFYFSLDCLICFKMGMYMIWL